MLEDLVETERAEVAEQQQPPVKGAGDTGRQQPRAGNELVTQLPEALDGRRGRGGALAANDQRLAALGAPRTIGRSLPGPLRCGSTTWSVKPVATAASKALPPRSSIARPVAEASQWVEATIPKVPRSSGRVVKLNVPGLPPAPAMARRGAAPPTHAGRDDTQRDVHGR